MRGKGVKTMNNITMEQRKEAFNNFINSKPFNDGVNTIANNKLTYYTWLKNYIAEGSVNKSETSIARDIKHIYKCMLLDERIECCNTSVVYFIRNQYNGLLKIGKTTNLARRIQEIEKCFTFLGMDIQKIKVEAISYCPYNMNNGQVESYYHDLFQEYRITGEWFDINYNILIENLNVDMSINNIIVTIEDPIDFPKGVKHCEILEADKDKLISDIKNNLYDKYDKFFEIFSHKWMYRKCTNKISSKEIYDYITSLNSSDDLNLDNKIINKIEQILKEVV